MGSPKVTYEAPKIEKDTTFAEYLEYQKEREAKLEERAADERAAEAAKDLSRRKTGARGLQSLYDRTASQLQSGLINYQGAQDTLRNYIEKYDLTAGGFGKDFKDKLPYQNPQKYLNQLDKLYSGKDGLLSQQRTAGVGLAYKDILGREATSKELKDAMKNLNLQAYGGAGIQGLRDSLKSSQEYTKKFNDNYLDNYYDVKYGDQTVNKKGEKTGKRIFNFDASLLPTFDGDLAEKSGVKYTTGKEFEKYFKKGRTVAELEAQQQNIRDTRQFIFSSGLQNLQGEIDEELAKIRVEGTKDVAKIQQEGSLYGQLLGGFNF